MYKGNISVKQAEIHDFSKNGQFPSDHFPVSAEIEFEPSNFKDNLALNKPAIGSAGCNPAEEAQAAFDGTEYYNSKFCSKSEKKWLQVDLGSTQEVSTFVIKHAGAGGEDSKTNTKDFNIEVSVDGNNWTKVVDVTGNTSNVTIHEISPVSARYVKLNITNTGIDNIARIYEFQVYGN